MHLFEVDMTTQAHEAAVNLGYGVQLTNIIRDIRSDLERDRIYLPDTDLERFGFSQQSFAQAVSAQTKSPEMLELLNFEITRAEEYYDLAWNGFPKERSQKRRLIAAQMMGKIYENILVLIKENPLQVLSHEVALNKWQKLGLTGRLALNAYLF
jgi:phytoene synthase